MGPRVRYIDNENGDYVTRAEMLAHLAPMRDDIADIKSDLRTLVGDRWLTPRMRKAVSALALAAVPALLALGFTGHL